MTRPCPRCGVELEGVPSALPQCGDTEIPALKFECLKCECVETVATGDPWRSAYTNLPPPKVTA